MNRMMPGAAFDESRCYRANAAINVTIHYVQRNICSVLGKPNRRACPDRSANCRCLDVETPVTADVKCRDPIALEQSVDGVGCTRK